jgi:GLPGLI family protein
MNNSYLIFIFYILFIQSIYSQNAFHAVYRIEFDSKSKKEQINELIKKDPNYDPTFTLNLIAMFEFYQKNVKVNLILNENKAISFYDGTMTSDAFNQIQKDFSQSTFETVYFSDLNSNKYYESYPFYGKNFNIIKKKSNWIITNESKKINDLLCFKAFDEKDSQIEIWFTYDFPFRVGPIKFNGAPGLIIEVKNHKISYILESISFKNVKTDKVKMPKGDIVTEEEMNKIGQKVRQAQYGRN